MTAEPGIAVTACAGRMGRAITATVVGAPGCRLASASQYPGHPAVGHDAAVLAGLEAAGIGVSADARTAFAAADAAIDFSTPAATEAHLAAAVATGTPLVVGTTGMDARQQRLIHDAAEEIAIVAAPNMSVGGALLAALTERVAGILGPDYDAEILGFQHRHKVDAPSGTALSLARAAALGRGLPPDAVGATHRDGRTGPRPAGPVGMATIQGGTVSGEHSAIFAGPGERLELAHKPSDRRVYAAGAVQAARWLLGRPSGGARPPGLYAMRDVLGLKLRGCS